MGKVSVIIPTKNRLQLLIKTLDNILNQSYSNLEIIVVDDGSTDGTIEEIQIKYQDKVKVIPNRGKGPGAGRNTGLEASTGQYIKFFDSDDLMTRNLIADQVKVLRQTGESAVYSPHVHFYEDERGQKHQKDVILQFSPISEKASIRTCMVKGFFTIIPAFLFSRSFLLDKVGRWREDLYAYEDWDLLWRIGGFIPNPVHSNASAVFYRVHGNQITGDLFTDLERERDKLRCFIQLFRNYEGDLSYLEQIIFKARIAESFSYLKDDVEARELLKEYVTPINHAVQFYLRLERKYNRFRTKSQWQMMHGICRDKSVFLNYLKNL